MHDLSLLELKDASCCWSVALGKRRRAVNGNRTGIFLGRKDTASQGMLPGEEPASQEEQLTQRACDEKQQAGLHQGSLRHEALGAHGQAVLGRAGQERLA